MKGLGRKASFLTLVTVVAVAVMGAAYALWFEDLKLTATVTTGELDGAMNCGLLEDNEQAGWPAPPFPHPPFPPFESYPEPDPLKNVVTETGSDGEFPFHEWTVTVDGAYPGYAFDCELHLLNSGTVPWHIEEQTIMITGPDGYVLNVDCNDPYANPCVAGTEGINTSEPIFAQFFENWLGCQVHTGDFSYSQSVFVGVNQPAKEGVTYTIMFKFKIVQWNESDWDGCGDPREVFANDIGVGGVATLPTRFAQV